MTNIFAVDKPASNLGALFLARCSPYGKRNEFLLSIIVERFRQIHNRILIAITRQNIHPISTR